MSEGMPQIVPCEAARLTYLNLDLTEGGHSSSLHPRAATASSRRPSRGIASSRRFGSARRAKVSKEFDLIEQRNADRFEFDEFDVPSAGVRLHRDEIASKVAADSEFGNHVI